MASLFRPVPLIVAVAIAAALKIMDFPEWQIFSLAGIYALWSAVGSWRLSLSGFDEMWREATGEEPPQSWLRPATYLILNIVVTVSWIAVLAFVGIAAANFVERLV